MTLLSQKSARALQRDHLGDMERDYWPERRIHRGHYPNGMKSELGNVQTRSITFHFLSASIPGNAELFVKVEKKGRSLSTCNARLVQGEKTIAVAIATFATKRSEFGFRDFEAPEVPFPEQIESSKRMNSELVSHAPFRDHYDQRLAIGKIPPKSEKMAE